MFDCSASIQPAHRRKLFTLTVGNPMTQQFSTINDALKWCIDHPDQRLRDKDGREIWCVLDIENNASIRIAIGGSNLFQSELKGLDLPTLRPLEAEPEKPTYSCMFCQKHQDEVVKMIVSTTKLTICNECIEHCQSILGEIPAEAEPEKPTLKNLAALENWDWFDVTLPIGRPLRIHRVTDETDEWEFAYFQLQTALSAGWPVEFGRGDAK